MAGEVLTRVQVKEFAERGFVSGIKLFDREVAERQMSRLEEIERLHHLVRPADSRLGPSERPFCDWVIEMASHPLVLGAARAVLGSTARIRNIDVFDKAADWGLGSGNSWHRDCDFDDPEGDRLLTAWFALVDATRFNGCMRFIDGSHRKRSSDGGFPMRWALRAHPVVLNCLPAGTMSLHHARLIHRARGNISNRRRVAIAVRIHASGPRSSPPPNFVSWR